MFSHISSIFTTMKCCHWVVTSCYLFPSPLLSAVWITKTQVHKTKHRSMFLSVQPLAISVVQCWWMVLHCHLRQTRFCWQLEGWPTCPFKFWPSVKDVGLELPRRCTSERRVCSSWDEPVSWRRQGGWLLGFWPLFAPVAWQMLIIVTRWLKNFVMKWLSCLLHQSYPLQASEVLVECGVISVLFCFFFSLANKSKQ